MRNCMVGLQSFYHLIAECAQIDISRVQMQAAQLKAKWMDSKFIFMNGLQWGQRPLFVMGSSLRYTRRAVPAKGL